MAAAREFSMTLGGLTIPGTISGVTASIHDVYRARLGSRDFDADFSILLYGASTNAALATAIATLRAAFTAPLGDLVLTSQEVGGGSVGTLLSLKFSDKTAFSPECEVEKVGEKAADSARSCLLRVRFKGERPYTIASPASGSQGLRDFTYSVSYTASRRATLTLSGEYTAQAGGLAAKAQFAAQFPNLYTAITTIVGGTWPTNDQPVSEEPSSGRYDEVYRFSRTYKELIYNEIIGTLDDPNITDHRITVTVDTDGLADSRAASSLGVSVVEKPQRLIVSYGASIDHNDTRDLKAIWENRALPMLIALARTYLRGGGRLVVERASLKPTVTENSIEGELIVVGYSAVSFIRAEIIEEYDIAFGSIISDVWPTEAPRDDTDPTPAYEFQGPKSVARRITTTTEALSAAVSISPSLPGNLGGFLSRTTLGAGTLIPIKKSSRVRDIEKGIPGLGDLIQITEKTLVEEFRINKQPPGTRAPRVAAAVGGP